jgi:hypothetical protein
MFCGAGAALSRAFVDAAGTAGFGVGKIHGVTPITTALNRSARRNRLSIYGIGSNPPALNGWQREIRRAAYIDPFKAPCFSIASIAYCEHVG